MASWGAMLQAMPEELVEQVGTVLAAVAILASAAAAWIHWRIKFPRPAKAKPAKAPEAGALDVVRAMEMAEMRRDMEEMRTEFRAGLSAVRSMLAAVHAVTHERDDELAVPRMWTMLPAQRAGLTFLRDEVASFRQEVMDGLEDLQDRLDKAAS